MSKATKTAETKEEVIRKYVEAKVKIRALEAIVDARKAQIKEILLAEKDHEIYVEDTDNTIQLKSRPVYEYTGYRDWETHKRLPQNTTNT